MDRSFLSDHAVVEMSRKFVCIRPLSYEDEAEAAFLKTFQAGRSGEVENTVFCMLSPDGKQRMIRPSRTARQIYADAKAMADGMGKIAQQFPAKNSAQDALPPVPFLRDFRLALNVASCDKVPLVVIQGSVKEIEATLAKLAWSPEFQGKFLFAKSEPKTIMDLVEGALPESRILVVQPDEYGSRGKVVFQSESIAEARMTAGLKAGLEAGQKPALDFWSHVRKGHQQGVFWETKLPVTDKEELNARERARKNLSPKK